MRRIERVKTWLKAHRLEAAVAVMSFGLLIALLSPFIFVTIPPGSVGVLWSRLFGGTVNSFVYGEGLKVILPWDRVYVYETRLQRHDQLVTSLSEDGLPVTTSVTLRFRVNAKRAPALYHRVGPDYRSRLLEPTVTAAVTDVIIANQAQELYTLARSDLERKIAADIRGRLHDLELPALDDGDLVLISGFVMRKISLPPAVQDAISEKLRAQQVAQQYDFILQRERAESERKAIEAEGVRRFQEVVSSNITDSYLRWRGIDATLQLAQSPNSKVVVIGNGPGSMPLILGGLEGGGSSAPAPQRAQQPQRPQQPQKAQAPAANAKKPASAPLAFKKPEDLIGPSTRDVPASLRQ